MSGLNNEDAKRKYKMAETTILKFIDAAESYNSYDKQPRHYGTEDILYMREAYFIQAVARCEKPEIGKIAEMLGVTPGAASQTASRLENKGLITRTRSHEDSRIVLVQLTERAKELNAYHDELDFREYVQLADRLADFTPENMNTVYRFLDIMGSFFHDDIEDIMKNWTYTPETAD